MIRGALFGYPDASGRSQCRLMITRGAGGRIAAWLMCNPSEANHLIDDPTMGRVVQHSANVGCDTSWAGNMWPWRTPYPADLWTAIRAGNVTDAMMRDNLDVLGILGTCADELFVAFGAEPMRRYPEHCRAMLAAFTLDGTRTPLCLGTTDDNLPLHPLARGKHAIRTGTVARPWVY